MISTALFSSIIIRLSAKENRRTPSDHEEGEGERRAGDFVGTHNENDGLQDGRHDRFPCTTEPQVIPWDNAHVFKINHEPFTDEKKAGCDMLCIKCSMSLCVMS